MDYESWVYFNDANRSFISIITLPPPFLPTDPRSLQGSQDRYTGVVLRKPPHPLQELWQCQSDAVSVQEAEDGPGGEHG